MRERSAACPVRLPGGQRGWVLTRYRDVRDALTDPRFSRAQAWTADRPRFTQMPPPADSLIVADPPRHTELREPLDRALAGVDYERVDALCAQLVDEHLSTVATAGPPADLVAGLCRPVAVEAICVLLGIPRAEREPVFAWSARRLPMPDLLAHLGALLGVPEKLEDGVLAGLAGDPAAAPLRPPDRVGLALALLIAGRDTAAAWLSAALYLLARRPALRDRLAGDEASAPAVVRELLRWITLGDAGGFPRVTTEEVSVGDQVLPAGELVIPSIAAADHDPAAFAEPDRLDPDRAGQPDHLAFGAGRHRCAGAPLAEIVARTVLAAVPRRLPELTLAGKVEWRAGPIVRDVEQLRVTWRSS
jgi:cytochrome P450